MPTRCQFCVSPRGGEYPSFQTEVDALRKGASAGGCPFCALVVRGTAAIESHLGKVAKSVKGEWNRGGWLESIRITLTYEDGGSSDLYEFYTATGKNPPSFLH